MHNNPGIVRTGKHVIGMLHWTSPLSPTAMRTHLLLSFAGLYLTHGPLKAQLLAGQVPDGLNAMVLDQTLSLSQAFSADSIALEFDCDDSQDAWVVLYRGAPEVDGPNSAVIHFLDDDVEVCASLAPPIQVRPKYHVLGDALDCAGDFDWQISDELMLGDFGGFIATGPISIDSMYVGYKRGSQTGWMLLSFDLQGEPAVTLTAHRLLPICPGATSVDVVPPGSGISMHPNPGNGEYIRVESATPLISIELLDATGRSLSQHDGTVRIIPSPTAAGTYFVRALLADGRISLLRLIDL